MLFTFRDDQLQPFVGVFTLIVLLFILWRFLRRLFRLRVFRHSVRRLREYARLGIDPLHVRYICSVLSLREIST